MIILRFSHNTRIRIDQKALDIFYDHRQMSKDSPEKGGVLVGEEKIRTKPEFCCKLRITGASGSMPGDSATPTSLSLTGPGHQEFVDQEKKRIYNLFNIRGVIIGYWHTHSEIMPTHSRRDIRAWKKMLERCSSEFPRFHMIIGQIFTSIHLHCPDLKPTWHHGAICNTLLTRYRRKS